MQLDDEGLIFVELDDLWIDVERIVAIRTSEAGGSKIYCEEAHLFLVSMPPVAVMERVRAAVDHAMHRGAVPAAPFQQYMPGVTINGPGMP